MSSHRPKKSSHRSKPAKPTKPKSSGADFEEIRPQAFFVRNPGVRPFIKGEGIIDGPHFQLTSWRRAGLIARLEMNGFQVLTLEKQVDSLPALPAAVPIGEPFSRSVSSNENYSYFDPQTLHWTPIEPTGEPANVVLCEGWIIRRRRGRGASDYYRAFGERNGGAGLVLLNETRALLMGYAQAAGFFRPPFKVTLTSGHYHVPDLPLPSPHRDLLKRLGEYNRETGWQVNENALPLACCIYERLGLRIAVRQQNKPARRK